VSATPVAVITGGAGGLGSVIGRVLAADGFQVILADRDLAAAEKAAAGIGELHGSAPRPQAFEIDITDQQAVTHMAEAIRERFSRIDVVVNNADVERNNSLERTSVADWDLTMDVNVKGAMLLCQAAVPAWRAQGSGAVVNISSRAYMGGSKNAAYASSKAAIVGLTLAMAVELGPLGVRANAVAPSFVRTPFNEQRTDITDMASMIARYEALTPLRRLIEPEDVANAVAFLASDRARNITGEVIRVTAGSHLPAQA
jgi:NAD(P)-dependent dehydrogenase (short-subunit alcohol dehydrogenase family)